MYFDKEFLSALPSEPYAALKKISDKLLKERLNIDESDDEALLISAEFCAVLSVFSESTGVSMEVPDYVDGEELDYVIETRNLAETLKNITVVPAMLEQAQNYKKIFAEKFPTAFVYMFSEGDLKQIQELLDKLRELISKTKKLEKEHKDRLLKKLEKLQSELHKSVSDLDRFWGFCIDLSIVAGLMGKNAEPMSNLVKKIVAIIWPAQTRAYELSSSLPFKLLGQSDDDKSEGDKS